MPFSAGLDCTVAGWGLSQEIPVILQPENMKILHVKIYEKSKCKNDANIVQSKEYLCAGVPGMRFQAACVVTFTEIFVFFIWLKGFLASAWYATINTRELSLNGITTS